MLVEFLHENWKIFAWVPADMPGAPREFAEHSLEVFKDAKPVQQAIRRYSELRRRAIGEEVTRLLAANFIREIKIATWLANPVLVAKKNTYKLRMCIDYTSLNRYCPKDWFLLPRID